MSGKPRSRLANVEQQLADIKRRAELANCICREITIALPHEAFRASGIHELETYDSSRPRIVLQLFRSVELEYDSQVP
jgi:hypothetical protein